MHRKGEEGFTLLEVIIAGIVLSILIGIALYSIILGQTSMKLGMVQAQCVENVTRALGVMTPEIRQSGTTISGSGISVADAGKTLTFRKNAGFVNGSIRWSQPVTFAWKTDRTIERTGPVSQTSTAIGTVKIASFIDPDFLFSIGSNGDEVKIQIRSSLPLGDGSDLAHGVTETVLLRN